MRKLPTTSPTPQRPVEIKSPPGEGTPQETVSENTLTRPNNTSWSAEAARLLRWWSVRDAWCADEEFEACTLSETWASWLPSARWKQSTRRHQTAALWEGPPCLFCGCLLPRRLHSWHSSLLLCFLLVVTTFGRMSDLRLPEVWWCH